MPRFGSVGTQYFDGSGNPLSGGKIYFYETGTTTTKTTYSNEAESVANPQPLVLDADGRLPDTFFSGIAKAVLTDSADVTIQTTDPIGADVGSTEAFLDWSSNVTYGSGDIVTGSNGLYYVSLSGSNLNNNPTTDATNWTQFVLTRVWNTNETYASGDLVKDSNGVTWKSVVSSNSGNDPTSDTGSNWLPAIPVNIYQDTYFFDTVRYESQTTDASIDLGSGMYFTMTITGTTTFTFDSVPSAGFFGFVLKLTNGGSQTVNWPASVDWPAATAPTLTTAGVDLLRFVTDDGGTTWYGLLTDGDTK